MLSITGAPLKDSATAKWILPVRQEAPQVEAQAGVVRLAKGTELWVTPEADASLLARLPKGAVVRQVARVGGFAKVTLDKERFAFVKAGDAKGGPKLKPALVAAMEPAAPARVMPRIVFNEVDPTQGGLVTSEDRFALSGTIASQESGPVDLYVQVNGQKVFFQTLAHSDGMPARAGFSTEVPLKEGLNHVQVVAHEGPDSSLRETLVIRRRPAGP
jgi:carboxyl-terminal processing protease